MSNDSTTNNQPEKAEANVDALPQGIAAVIGNILAADSAESYRMFEQVKESPEIQDALASALELEPEHYYFALPYKFQQIQEGLLASANLTKGELLFIFRHHDFLEAQLESLFERFEGRACSVDKAHCVIGALVRHFAHGTPIIFNHTQRYTYHLPKAVLTSEADVLRFFRVVWDLYYGRAPGYVAYMNELNKALPEIS